MILGCDGWITILSNENEREIIIDPIVWRKTGRKFVKKKQDLSCLYTLYVYVGSSTCKFIGPGHLLLLLIEKKIENSI